MKIRLPTEKDKAVAYERHFGWPLASSAVGTPKKDWQAGWEAAVRIMRERLRAAKTQQEAPT